MRRKILLAAAIAVVVLHNVAVHPWMLDDAFISFRYAENLAVGNGPVYNTGERVEGYTCFLWVALLATGNLAGLDTPLWSRILGWAFSIGCLLLLFSAHRFSNRFTPGQSAVAALFLGTCGAFTPWAGSGMEVTLFTFLMLLSLLLSATPEHERRLDIALGVFLALLSMTRPEGLLAAGLIFVDRALLGIRRRSWRCLLPIGIFAAIFVPYFLWRWNYYGFLLPNTFYAKVGFSAQQAVRGLKYTAAFVVAVLPLVLWFALSNRKEWQSGNRLMLLVAWTYAIYVIAVGGDIMPAFRFFTPILPLLCLIAAAAVVSRSRRAAILLSTVAVGYNLVQLAYHPQIHRYILSDKVVEEGREVGTWLRRHASPGAVIATNTGGTIPYYSRLRSVDMLGLNDSHIAHREISWIGTGPAGHEKGDGAYVLARQPDFIQFGSSRGDRTPRFLSDQELWQIPEFHEQYELKTIRLPSGLEGVLFVRRGGNAP